jgi:adenine-specific DNA-methyltransferase
VAEKCPDYKSFCDVFAGTGVVGYHFNRPQVRILSNDLLMSNFISLQAWLGTRSLNQDRIRNFINYLNEIRPRSENYVSKSFGAAYFTMENARKIGAVREEVEKLSVSEDEKNILLTSLIYAVDKVANTVGHYETFRKRLDTTAPLTLLMPDISTLSNSGNHIYRRDANDLVRDIEVDVLYLDPPYNSRQYGDSYHLLENIVAWKKPKVFGVGRKMAERDNLKSKYCLKEAPSAFQDLIDNCRAKHILLSYNNTAEKMNSRSNARISDEFITKILTRRGRVEVFEREYRGFTTGKSKDLGNSERIFYCKVER